MQAAGNAIQIVAVSAAEEDAIMSSACDAAGAMDLTFIVPPSCDLELKLYFASSNTSEQHQLRVPMM